MLHRSTRRTDAMRCDAYPTANNSNNNKQTHSPKNVAKKWKGEGERGSRRSAANIPFQESFETKTKMTKFWAARKASRKRKAIEVRLKRKSTRSGERKRERERVLVKSAEKRNRQERDGEREEEREAGNGVHEANELWGKSSLAALAWKLCNATHTNTQRDSHTHTNRHALMVSAALAFVVVGSARETS